MQASCVPRTMPVVVSRLLGRLLPLVVAAATLATAGRAHAEINIADSVEWMTADADLVVRGPVTAVTRRPGPGDVVWYYLTVRVDERLKGKVGDQVTLIIRDLAGLAPTAWRDRGEDRLWFLVDSARRVKDDRDYARARWALRPGDGATLALDGGTALYTADFAALTARDAILAAVRAAATSTATRVIHLDAPYDSPAFRGLYGGSAVWINVPVDAALEARALAWTTSSELGLRERAATVLASFRSPHNIGVLQRLLTDPGFAIVTETGKAQRRRYLVRAAAHHALTAWGVRHRPPIIEQAVR